MSGPSTDSDKTGFYVGYLPTPSSHRRFLMVIMPVLFVGFIALAFSISFGQRDPGASSASVGSIQSWTGTLFVEPYPMLITDTNETYLVMGIGKFGVLDRVKSFNGTRVQLDGWNLERSGRRGIQLDPEPNAVRSTDDGVLPRSRPIMSVGREVVLAGEIVDGKCYIGAMKPGDGKGHKACAILCLGNGLPPLFAAANSDEFDVLPLILVDGSAELTNEFLSIAGEPVQLVGQLHSYGDLTILSTRSRQVERWNSVSNP